MLYYCLNCCKLHEDGETPGMVLKTAHKTLSGKDYSAGYCSPLLEHGKSRLEAKKLAELPVAQ